MFILGVVTQYMYTYFTDWSIYSWTTVLQLVLIFSVRKLNFRVHVGVVHTVQSHACAYLWFQHVFYYDIKAPCIELFEHNWAQVAVGKCVWKGQFLYKCTLINVRYKRILTSGFLSIVFFLFNCCRDIQCRRIFPHFFYYFKYDYFV